jgi:GntR family transcriptional regulator/MocR family aminotransferase
VLITGGAQQALDWLARLLADPGDVAWVEDPGYLGARTALTAAGLQLCPLPVDAAGLNPAAASAHTPTPRLIYVTPSHQYPCGAVMPLARRLWRVDHRRRLRQ